MILDSIGKQTHKKPLKLVCIGYNWRDVHKNALIKLKKTDFWRAMKFINSHLERIDSNTCMQLCMRMHGRIQPCAHHSVPFILFSVAIDPIQNEQFGSVSFPNYIDSIYPGIITNEMKITRNSCTLECKKQIPHVFHHRITFQFIYFSICHD